MSEIITRVPVWSASLRWTHAIMGLSVLVLLLTGKLSQADGSLAASARGYHYMAAYLFVLSFCYRIYLLFAGVRSEHISDFMPKVNRAEVTSRHLRFYLSLGKSELTGWYAHNPFWGPVYLAVFAVSLFLILTGFAIGNVYLGTGMSLSGVHAFAANIMLIFTGLHLFAVILHDVRAETTGVSAMLSGSRYFTREEQQPSGPVEFPVTFIGKPGKKKQDS